MEINLGKGGMVRAEVPKSLATCLDFVMLFNADMNRSQLLRLCAATIGVCVDSSRILPAYPIKTGNPVEWGHGILDRLLAWGVPVAAIFEIGTDLLSKMGEGIKFTEEVETAVNFSDLPGAD